MELLPISCKRVKFLTDPLVICRVKRTPFIFVPFSFWDFCNFWSDLGDFENWAALSVQLELRFFACFALEGIGVGFGVLLWSTFSEKSITCNHLNFSLLFLHLLNLIHIRNRLRPFCFSLYLKRVYQRDRPRFMLLLMDFLYSFWLLLLEKIKTWVQDLVFEPESCV